MPGLTYADFRTVDYSGLLRGDVEAVNDLSRACHEDGFFYLYLGGAETQGLLTDWKLVLEAINEWFDRPLEQKMKHKHTGTIKHGYCPIGSYTGVYKGTKDGNETIKVTADAMRDPQLCPEVINENRPLFERFTSESRNVTLELLKAISGILKLEGQDRVEHVHRTSEPSSSCLNLIRYVKSEDGNKHEGQNQHSDNGTLTFLLSEQAGLEVVSKDTGNWEPVLPKPNHAIVNVADTLRFLSGLRFRSAIHRAVPKWSPGQKLRFVVGYFLRAEDSAILRNTPIGTVTAAQWHDAKYENYVKSHQEQTANKILLGGMEVNKEKQAGHLFDLPELPAAVAI